MNSITAILIDDEISNLKGLEQKLSDYFPEIVITHKFQVPEDAVSLLNKQQPDLVFLDIEMPRINGFDLLAKIENLSFQVIFVTAYSEYAIEAFKQNAVDYILKPIDNKDLVSAVNKALDVHNSKKDLENNHKLVSLLSSTLSNSNKVIVPTSKGISFVPKEEVLHFEGYEGYTKIHLANSTVLTSSYNLGKFEKLICSTFFKCHKSHIVNIEHVRHFENEGYLVLDNDKRVPISRSQKKIFLNLFKL